MDELLVAEPEILCSKCHRQQALWACQCCSFRGSQFYQLICRNLCSNVVQFDTRCNLNLRAILAQQQYYTSHQGNFRINSDLPCLGTSPQDTKGMWVVCFRMDCTFRRRMYRRSSGLPARLHIPPGRACMQGSRFDFEGWKMYLFHKPSTIDLSDSTLQDKAIRSLLQRETNLESNC